MALKNQAIASANPSAIANKNYINALYKEAYGRNATQAELTRFANSTVKDAANIVLGASVSPFSTNTPKNIQTVDSKEDVVTDESKAQMEAINNYINSLGFDESQKQLLRYMAEQTYKTDNKVYNPSDVKQLLQDAATNAETDLNPYYEKTTARDIEDLRNKYSDIRNQVSRYTQQEQKSYAEKLKDTKAKLRASGLTFSGSARSTLGKQGAISDEGVEGTVPQQRRYDIEDYYSTVNQNARDIGLAAERKLGSAKISDIQGEFGKITSPYEGGIDYDASKQRSLYEASKQGTSGYVGNGDLELERLKELEKSKWSRLGQIYK